MSVPPLPDELSAASLTGPALFEAVAADLYHLALMLVGESEQVVELIEAAIQHAEISSCCGLQHAIDVGRRALAAAVIRLIAAREPEVLTTPEFDPNGPATCITDSELDSTGVTSTELDAMLDGPNRARLRTWLEDLGNPLRLVFVLRAVADIPSAELAAIIAGNGGEPASGWTADGVRFYFRQALCSLASQILHATGRP